MKTKNLIILVVMMLLGLGISYGLTVTQVIDNSVAYIKKLILTDNGTDSGTKNIVLDGQTGKISGKSIYMNNNLVATEKYTDSKANAALSSAKSYTDNHVVDGAHIANGSITKNKLDSDLQSLVNNNFVRKQICVAYHRHCVFRGFFGCYRYRTICDRYETIYELRNGIVTSDKIASNAVTSSKIADKAITSDKIANGAVTSSKIKDGEVKKDDIANGAVTEDKIANGAVISDKIANGAVTSGKIADKAVTSGKIADKAVTSGKIDKTDNYVMNELTTSGLNLSWNGGGGGSGTFSLKATYWEYGTKKGNLILDFGKGRRLWFEKELNNGNKQAFAYIDSNGDLGLNGKLYIWPGALSDGSVLSGDIANGAITPSKLVKSDTYTMAALHVGKICDENGQHCVDVSKGLGGGSSHNCNSLGAFSIQKCIADGIGKTFDGYYVVDANLVNNGCNNAIVPDKSRCIVKIGNFYVAPASTEKLKDYRDAKSYCSNLNIGGKSFWYLPNLNNFNIISQNIQNVDGLDGFYAYYWANTLRPFNSSGIKALTVEVWFKQTKRFKKNELLSVRCCG